MLSLFAKSKLKLAQKISIMAGILILLTVSGQTLISSKMIDSTLGVVAIETLNLRADETAKSIGSLLLQIEADLSIASAHDAIEGYFDYLSIEELDAMEEEIIRLELFLSRVTEIKPQYSKLELISPTGSVINMENGVVADGSPVEHFDQVKALISKGENEKLLSVHKLQQSQNKLFIISFIPVIIADEFVGIIESQREVSAILNELFLNAEKQSIAISLVQTNENHIIDSTFSSKIEKGVVTSDPINSLNVSREMPELDLELLVSVPKQVAYAVSSEIAVYTWIGSLINIIFIILMLIFVCRRLITKPLAQVTTFMADVVLSGGDLTKKMNNSGNDEIAQFGQHFDNFVESIRGVILIVVGIAVHIAEASDNIKKLVYSNKESAEKQFTESSTILQSMEHLSQEAEDIKVYSTDVADSVNITEENCQLGRESMELTVTMMNNMSNEVVQASDANNKIKDHMNHVAKAISEISSIAEQTNLLALNAAIEAARAGDQGRGFTVVAQEVRQLATNTQTSTTKVNASIKALSELIEESTKVVSTVNEQKDKVVEHLTRSKQSFDEITDRVNTINDLNSKVQALTEDQHQRTKSTVQSAALISELSKASLEGTEQAGAAGENLNLLAEQLSEMVDKFTVEIPKSPEVNERDKRYSTAQKISNTAPAYSKCDEGNEFPLLDQEAAY